MSTSNQISREIPQEIINDVLEKLNECKKALQPFMEGLTAEQRRVLFKMGDKTVSIVQKTQSYTDTNPEFIPTYMDINGFNIDVTIVNQLRPIEELAKQISEDVSDTSMLAGSEALQQALLYYGQVREAYSKGVTSSRAIYEDLQTRFSRRRVKPNGQD
ncbi:hypothetical protein [Flavobacterium sp.]|uniref:hypothetical protein n=1 Tax=Flavobacterium sp. TaxID=239 RepID=UPI00261ABDAA|nr:hypothetical protein [Flavobacterium sp.]MDD3004691.1 hypothetical protein [Flavobacterium sp.]